MEDTRSTPKFTFDVKFHVSNLEALLVSGESIEAVFSLKRFLNTGFVGMTNKRIIFGDKSYPGLQKAHAVVSIPYSRISSVGVEADFNISRKLIPGSRLAVTAGRDTYEFEFIGTDKAHIAHQIIMSHLL